MQGNSIKGIARLLIQAGKASPTPAIGQALGPLGVNMGEFCKKFNDETAKYNEGTPIPVSLTALHDRTYSFIVKTPSTSWLLAQCRDAGPVTIKHVFEVAKVKMLDPHLKHISHEAMCSQILGTAKSMGLEVATTRTDEP